MGFSEIVSPRKQVFCCNKSYNCDDPGPLCWPFGGGFVMWLWGKTSQKNARKKPRSQFSRQLVVEPTNPTYAKVKMGEDELQIIFWVKVQKIFETTSRSTHVLSLLPVEKENSEWKHSWKSDGTGRRSQNPFEMVPFSGDMWIFVGF